MARVFCRMGCHVLALDLVRSWSFEYPAANVSLPQTAGPPSPQASRAFFTLEPARLRRSSILIDMNVTSLPPSQPVSPPPKEQKPPHPDAIEDGLDRVARKTGMGTLMLAAKRDVQVPEFDMSAFF